MGKYIITIEKIVHAEVWTVERKNINLTNRRFEYEQNPSQAGFYISLICIVQDGTQKAKLYINNDQAIEALDIKENELSQFRDYDAAYGCFFTTSDTKRLISNQATLTN